MENLKPLVDDLNARIFAGDILGAFEMYYADDVVMQDNNFPVRTGKEECRKFEQDFVSKLTAFRGAQLHNVLISDGIVINEWEFDYTHSEWGDRKYKQVSVQRWKDGKIVEEKFYYNN